MKPQYSISNEVLNHAGHSCKVKYSSLFNSVKYLTQNRFNGSSIEISEVVQSTSRLFTKGYHAIKKEIEKEKLSTELSSAYAGFIAAKYVSESIGDKNSSTQTMKKETDLSDLVNVGLSTDYTLVKSTIDGYCKHINPEDVREYTKDYFKGLEQHFSSEIKKIAGENLSKDLSKIKWKINGYRFEGITFAPKKIIYNEKNNPSTSNENKNTIKNNNNGLISIKEKNDFYTPLEYLHIPQSSRLPKERIIGNQRIIETLERGIKCLFMYNFNERKNPMKEKGIFLNKYLLQGSAGTGKNMVANYIIDFAEKFANKLNSDFMVTNFKIESHWEDGKKQKLVSQINQLTTNNKLYLLFEDELDGLLFDSGKDTKKSDLQVIQEMNKFMQGQYQDKGNYFFLGTINDIKNLRISNKRRFNILNWEGAVTKEQKSLIFQYKLEQGMNTGFVELNKKDIIDLGERAYEAKLSGSDITQICNSVTSNSFDWNSLGKVYNVKEDYQKQLDMIDKLHNKVDFKNVYAKLEEWISHSEKASSSSERFNER